MSNPSNSHPETLSQTGSAGVVDIVFLLDVTGSMSPCIAAVKDNIANFVRTLCQPDENGFSVVRHWRAKVVGYRDYEDDKRTWLEDHPFIETEAALESQLASLIASGGGNEPESLLDALWTVVEMDQTPKGATPDPCKWRYRSNAVRCVIVFTDASFPQKLVLPDLAGTGAGTKDVINQIHAKRIILTIFAPEMDCHYELGKANMSEYHAIPCGDDTLSRQHALAEFTRDKKNFNDIMEKLAKSVSKSASVPTLD